MVKLRLQNASTLAFSWASVSQHLYQCQLAFSCHVLPNFKDPNQVNMTAKQAAYEHTMLQGAILE